MRLAEVCVLFNLSGKSGISSSESVAQLMGKEDLLMFLLELLLLALSSTSELGRRDDEVCGLLDVDVGGNTFLLFPFVDPTKSIKQMIMK